MARQTKQEKERDKLIERTYYKYGYGVQINVMDIPKIFKVGRVALETGADLDAAIQSAIVQLRQN